MDTIDSKPIGIKEVMHRYGISSPSTWAEWLKEAGIQSFTVGRNRFIYTYQLPLLDAIAHERNRPINTSSAESIETVLTEHFQHFQEPKVSEVFALSDVEVLSKIAKEIICTFRHVPDPDQNLLRLERYAEKNWRISSKDLATLLGLKSMPISPYYAKGFWFDREGREWKVSKLKE